MCLVGFFFCIADLPNVMLFILFLSVVFAGKTIAIGKVLKLVE